MIVKITDSINAVLSEHGVSEIDIRDIIVTDNSVSDVIIPGSPLSNKIIDKLWPSIRELEVYHYTSEENAEKILASEPPILRLYSILKRYGESEIESFCKNHNLTGYLHKNKSGEPYYKTNLMSDLFYTSFTDVNINSEQEEYFWNTFAGSNGARFKFKITAQNPNFRKVIYENKPGTPISLLKNISDKVAEFNRVFFLKGMSRLCSFYLAKSYDIESEQRMLFKKYNGFGPDIKHDSNSGFEYIDQKIGVISEAGYLVELLEVQSNSRFKMPPGVKLHRRNT